MTTNLSHLSLPPTLNPPLTGREAIVDAAYRVLLGFDTNDPELFTSAFAEEATFDLSGRVTQGRDAILSDLFHDRVSKLDTMHYLTNIRINITDGDTRARMSASMLAQHCFGGEGMKADGAKYLAGGLCVIEFVKVEGEALWKVTSWKIHVHWADGDSSVELE
ncbi:hypothetical protein M406DRAFT_340956 [Cryphonectria parasitica EP155]|uniref:SnoaL-like domain-containing protein n=1 Tax=Cryphonectria parasitica (strain ATCC 38755 / EP155) TaxID=660469 RepID=A0A9P4XYR0_CRYP1|nr:uncharacterized protein M406DRAFT_340956 [Cryphonectria parasitica EP155]KAF3763364.1 hypothetical protein M406DRAFT_340956 [Cryphonectria parasitica EP155]